MEKGYCMTGMLAKVIRIVLVVALFSTIPLYAWANLESYTHRLSQSTPTYKIWTTTPSERVFQDDAIPDIEESTIKIYAARNEFEPFQIIVNPVSTGNVVINIDDFGSGIKTDIHQVKYINISQATDSLGRTGPYPDPLWPIEKGESISLRGGQNSSFWISVFVHESTPAGDYTTNVHLAGVSVPVELHVFNFAIPAKVHVKSQMNFSHETILDKYGISGPGAEYWMYVDKMKQFFIDHRLTPKSVLWSGGLTSSGGASYINYDCDTGIISDPHGIWGFEQPAERYLEGTGVMDGMFTENFNDGTGFPSFMAITFRNNDSSADQRPSSFCDLTRSSADWYSADNPNSVYNQKWFQYMTDTESYLSSNGYLDKAYYYFANEPQDPADYQAVAWYSRYLKQAAPNLKLMVSENPRPEIYNDANYVGSGQIDIWLPVLNQYDPAVSHDRETNHGEESWIYFLHGTRPPYFNPITLDHPGIESKLTGWFLWKYRIKGIAYYSVNNWEVNPWTFPMTSSHNGDRFMLYPPSENNSAIPFGSNNHRFVPSIRFELMRDSLEDYEYLYLLNGGEQPAVGVPNDSDIQANKIINGVTSYTRDSEFMYNLRRVVGLKNGNEITAIPDITPPALHPRAEAPAENYYINFQDPSGNPTADPFVVDGKTYMKIGWNTYDQNLGYGWYGDMAHVMYQWLPSGPNGLQQSILYDDWGREKVFEFDLPNGTYNVTVSVGWQGKTYSRNFIAIEGTVFINDEATDPYLVRTNQLTVSDNKLTMELGIFNEYTMLNYLEIEPIFLNADFTGTPLSGGAPLSGQFLDMSTSTPTFWKWDFDNDGRVDSVLQNPEYTYDEAGTYSVSLIISNSTGSGKIVKNGYVNVYNKGDFDCDGEMDIKDTISILQITSGRNVELGKCLTLPGDLDENGVLGLGDIISSLQSAAGLR